MIDRKAEIEKAARAIDDNIPVRMVLTPEQAERAATAAIEPLLDRLGAQEAWQPIDSAPLDGEHILLSDGDAVTIGRDIDGKWFELNSDPTDYWDGELHPTHWMPLPDPPSAAIGIDRS